MKIKIYILIIPVFFWAYSCSDTHMPNSQPRIKCPVAEQEMDSLFNGIEIVIFRPGYDTINLVYCVSFKNGRGCIVSMKKDSKNGFFCDINNGNIDSHKYSLTEDYVFFKEWYGCDIAQIRAMIYFCKENDLYSVSHYSNHHITFNSHEMPFFYSKDSLFFNTEMFDVIGQNWYVPRRK